MKLEQEIVRTDILIVGGGLAGCMAAIRAGEIVGAGNVLLVEKAHVRRSGNAATGVDHTWSYMPEVHKPMGYTVEQLVEDHVDRLGELQDQDLIRTIASNIAKRIKEMESWGLPFKTKGEYDYVKKIHRVPTFLHWAGRDQKVLFTKELLRRGIKVANRIMITDSLYYDARMVGAIGLSVREQKFFIFLTKAVVLTTGGVSRLFPGSTSWEYNRCDSPCCTGDGVALAYRAGAEVTGLEFLYRHSGPKNFCKAGRGTWIGVIEDAKGNPLGEVKAVADPKKVDLSVESPADMIKAYKEGRAPILMNCSSISEEDLAYMEWGLSNEGNTALLDHMKEMGIDPRKDKVEFTFYELGVRGGLVINPKGETNISGLFAAGDIVGNVKRGVSPGAFVIGWISGESAATFATGHDSEDIKVVWSFIEEKRTTYQEIINRAYGANWKEALVACQDLINHYAGNVRYETLLQQGLANLRKIRKRALGTLAARNPHELMHCIEALNIMDIGEAVILCALERKESRVTKRETFARVDYPEVNDEMNKFLIMKLENGRPVFNWREPRRM